MGVVHYRFTVNGEDMVGDTWEDHSYWVAARKVRADAPHNVDDIWEEDLSNIPPVADVLVAAQEITEEEADRLTGHYMRGYRALGYAQVLCWRVPKTDPLYLAAQAVDAILAALAPDCVASQDHGYFVDQSRKAAAQERKEAIRAGYLPAKTGR